MLLMKIVNTTLADLETVFSLYRDARALQKAGGFNLWPEFENDLIQKEIAEKRHWKLCKGDEIAAVFSVLYSDPLIWGAEADAVPSVYLHRIAVHPSYRGQQIISRIKDWGLEHGRMLHKKRLRMDTWGDNEKLRNYYLQFGFRHVGQRHVGNDHYGGPVLSLLEAEI